MTAGDGDLHRHAREVLAADLGHVERGARGGGAGRAGGRAQRAAAGERVDDLGEVLDAVDLEAVDDAGLGAARGGDEHAAQLLLAREHRRGEHAGHLAHGAVEAELAEDEQAGERGAVVLVVADEDGGRDRQIERGAGLAQIGGREVHRDALEREIVADRLERAADPDRALLHRGGGQADDLVDRQAARDLALDVDDRRVDADERAGLDERDHAASHSTMRASERLKWIR